MNHEKHVTASGSLQCGASLHISTTVSCGDPELQEIYWTFLTARDSDTKVEIFYCLYCPFFLSRDSHELPESNDIYSFFQNLSCLGLECFLIKCYLLSQVTNLLPEITETRQPGQKLSPAVSSVTGFTTQIPDAIAYQNKSLPLHPLLLVLTLFFSPSYNAQFWNTLYPQTDTGEFYLVITYIDSCVGA